MLHCCFYDRHVLRGDTGTQRARARIFLLASPVLSWLSVRSPQIEGLAMIYVFGAYEFDTGCHVLRLAGTPVDLEPRVFDLLTYLIQHPDQFVSRETLYAQLWPQQFVSDAALTYCIAEARKAVGDSGRAQRVIKTVHGRGYRFIAPVAEYLPDGVSGEAAIILPP